LSFSTIFPYFIPKVRYYIPIIAKFQIFTWISTDISLGFYGKLFFSVKHTMYGTDKVMWKEVTRHDRA
jgi:hypothetical protein